MAASKLIFTSEGRASLVTQLNGIRFAILGAVLIQGLDPVDDFENLYDTYKSLTWEELSKKQGITLGLKNVSYKAVGNNKIVVKDRDEYNNAIDNIANNVLPLHYIPSLELIDKKSNIYGIYEFDFDKTSLTWDNANPVAFTHIGLIGKCFAETKPATYNVDKTQKPSLFALIQVGLGDPYEAIYIENDKESYASNKFEIRLTLDDGDNDIGDLIVNNSEILDISKKIKFVNDGLKTIDDVDGVIIGEDDTVMEDLRLNKEGSIATTKTLMVADAFPASDVENQFNAAGLIHVANKKDDDNDYKRQYILTTLEQPPEDQYDAEQLTAYNASIWLKSDGDDINRPLYNHPRYAGYYQGTETPIFLMDSIPESDEYAVDIFGVENTILKTSNNNTDKMLFSKNNVSINPSTNNNNVLIHSNNNVVNGNLDNTFIHSNFNAVEGEANGNILLNGSANLISERANNNAIINTEFATVTGNNVTKNTIIGGKNNELIDNASNDVLLGGTGLKSISANQVILGTYNKFDEEASSAAFIIGCGTSDTDRRNALEFYSDRGELKLFKEDGTEAASIGGEGGITLNNMTISNIDASHIDVQTINSDYFSAQSGFISDYILFSKDGHNTIINNLGMLTDSNGGIRWENNGNVTANITDYSISLPGVGFTAQNQQLYIQDHDNTVLISPYNGGMSVTGGDSIIEVNAHITQGPITFKQIGTDIKEYASTFREFKQDIFIMTDSQRLGWTTVIPGYWTDSSMPFKHDNPNSTHVLASTIKDAIANCMFGYTYNDATGVREDTKYYAYLQRGTEPLKYGIFAAATVGSDGNSRGTNKIGSEFKFLNYDSEAYQYPLQFLKLPAGYDRIELNVYFRDLHDDGDFVFTMIPVINETIPLKNTEVIVNLHLDKNSEDVRFWQVKDWVDPDDRGGLFDPSLITNYIKFVKEDIDGGCIKTLRAIACPYKDVIGGYTNNVPVLGWFQDTNS